jgi:hypothetical protein
VDGGRVHNWRKYFHLVLDAPRGETRTCLGKGWLKEDLNEQFFSQYPNDRLILVEEIGRAKNYLGLQILRFVV